MLISQEKIIQGTENIYETKEKLSISCSTPVNMYDLNDNYIKTFHGMSEAQRETGSNYIGISRCCSGKQKTCGGYKWKLAEQVGEKLSNLTVLHLHSMDSNPYSGLEVDSITPFQAYIDKAKSEGMKAIAFTEHGAVLHNVAKRQACEKAGLKYINAE